MIDFDFGELNKLSTTLEGATRDLLPLVRTAVQKTSADIKRDAQAFAPVDTGNLRNSIAYETRELTDSVVGEVYATASYAHYVEFGTSRMAPHAYLGPALDRHGAEFEKAMEQIGLKATGL